MRFLSGTCAVATASCANSLALTAAGGSGGSCFRFVTSEPSGLLKKATSLIPSALFRTTGKLAGYRLRRAEASLPVLQQRHLSKFRNFWI